jgi:hypothetical protein
MAPRPHDSSDQPHNGPADYHEGPAAAKRFRDALTILAHPPKSAARPQTHRKGKSRKK